MVCIYHNISVSSIWSIIHKGYPLINMKSQRADNSNLQHEIIYHEIIFVYLKNFGEHSNTQINLSYASKAKLIPLYRKKIFNGI